MNKTLLYKDLRLMIKDLKFQVFFIIVLALFILSSFSSAVNYKNTSEMFQDDLNAHQGRVADGHYTQLMNMFNDNVIHVISKPSPAILFSNYSNYPDKIYNSVMFYLPVFDNYSSNNNEVFPLNWHFILGILCSFIMLIMSFECISSEKRAGTLRLLSIYGFKRQIIFWHKYISYMILYFVIIIPALLSVILFFAFTGLWDVLYLMKFLLMLLISIPFASFFTMLGIFISMAMNYRNTIVVIVFIWLLFVIIIPQSAGIIAKQLAPVKTNLEYRNDVRKAWGDEWDIWIEEYDTKVAGNGNIYDHLREKSVYAADEKRALANEIEIDDNKRFVNAIQNISAISPFVQYERISEIVFDKGYYLLTHQIETMKYKISQIKGLMLEQDAKDETSIHLFYSWANADRYAVSNQGKYPFSIELFEQPDLLFETNIPTDDTAAKTILILKILLPILILNLIMLIVSVIRLERLDIR
jgi:ABC-type transport system involved in multi-copper enzyme maturation permease subunit